jgi:hypothetical protein
MIIARLIDEVSRMFAAIMSESLQTAIELSTCRSTTYTPVKYFVWDSLHNDLCLERIDASLRPNNERPQ